MFGRSIRGKSQCNLLYGEKLGVIGNTLGAQWLGCFSCACNRGGSCITVINIIEKGQMSAQWRKPCHDASIVGVILKEESSYFELKMTSWICF